MASLEVPKTPNNVGSSASTLTGDVSPGEKTIGYNTPRDSESLHKKEPESTDDVDDVEYPSGIKMLLIVFALVMSIFLLSLDMVSSCPSNVREHCTDSHPQTIVATAIPKITDDFKGLDKVGWYGAAFFMTVGGFQSTWGKIYKFFPLKGSFLMAILIFEVGSAICGAAPSSNALIAGRAIAGVGAAGLGAGAYTIIAFAAPPKKRPAFTGILGAAYGLGSVIGPLLGGAFTDNVSWRWCFYINLPIGGVAAAVVFFFFRTPAHAVPEKATLTEKVLQMDLPGVVLIMGATVTFLLAVQYGGVSHAWNSSTVIGLIVGFVLIIAAWGLLQWWQGDRSMVSPKLISNRTNWVSAAFAFIFAGGFFTAIYYLPVYFQSVHGTSPTMSGVRNLPMIISVTISTIVSGALVSAFGYYQPLLIGGGVLATIGSGLLYMLDTDSSTGEWIGYQIIAGVGWGLAFQIPMIAVQGTAKPKDLAAATGMLLCKCP